MTKSPVGWKLVAIADPMAAGIFTPYMVTGSAQGILYL
jgi:hypothetical protein